MRIVFLTTVSMDSPSGGGRYLPLMQELSTLGHDVHIVALHHDFVRDTPRHLQLGGVHIHYVGQMQVRKRGNESIYFGPLMLLWVVLRGFLGLLWWAVRLKADLYHLGKPHPQNVFAGFIAARLVWRCPLLLDYDDLEVAINRFGNRLQKTILGALEQTTPKLVDAVTVHSRYLYDHLLSMGVPEERILRLPSAVDIKRFHAVDSAAIEKLRVRHKLYGRDIIGYVGTLSLVNHPVDLLILAFAKISATYPNAVLLLVGGGIDLLTLQKLADEEQIGEACRFVGRVALDEVPAYYKLMDMSVDPVEDDVVAQARWPLKIVESMAAGTPVLTSDVGDRRAMLGDGAAGLLVAPNSVDALAAGLEELLTENTLRANLSSGCLEQIQRFRADRVVEPLDALYRTISRTVLDV